MERMIEAIRKGYWDASQDTRRQLAERWQELASKHGINVGEDATKAFVEQMAAGFGLAAPPAPADAETPASTPHDAGETQPAAATQTVTGQVLEEIQPPGAAQEVWRQWAALSFMLGLIMLGAGIQWRANSARPSR